VQRCHGERFGVSFAKQMCDTHPGNFCRTSSPSAGDVYVYGGGSYGHTAIVAKADGSYVDVVRLDPLPLWMRTPFLQ
jgi:hypothetical protein